MSRRKILPAHLAQKEQFNVDERPKKEETMPNYLKYALRNDLLKFWQYRKRHLQVEAHHRRRKVAQADREVQTHRIPRIRLDSARQ